jgi:hypothetical protein
MYSALYSVGGFVGALLKKPQPDMAKVALYIAQYICIAV